MAKFRKKLLFFTFFFFITSASGETLASKPVCSQPYQAAKNQCYALLEENRTQSEAVESCQTISGVIAEVRDRESNDAIVEITGSIEKNRTFIGVKVDMDNLTTWFSVSGAEQVFTHWRQNEPSMHMKQNCVITNFVRPGLWDNVRCDDTYPVVCQIRDACPAQIVRRDGVPVTFQHSNGSTLVLTPELCPMYSIKAGVPKASRLCERYGKTTAFWNQPVWTDCNDGSNNQTATERIEIINQFASIDAITEKNVADITDALVSITDGASDQTLTREDWETVESLLGSISKIENTTAKATQDVVSILDNIISYDVSENETKLISTKPSRLLKSLEQQLHNFQKKGENLTAVGTNLVVKAFHLDKNVFAQIVVFPLSSNLSDFDESEGLDNQRSDYSRQENEILIELPADIQETHEVDRELGILGSIPVSIVVFDTLLLFPSKSEKGPDGEPEGPIVSFTLEGRKVKNRPKNDIVVTFPKRTSEEEEGDKQKLYKKLYTCVYWDVALNDKLGDWSTEGCTLGEYESNFVECKCNHLTSLSVLVHEVDNIALDIISKVGCVLSIAGLIITIISFLAVKKMRSKQPQQILLNLCIALLGMYLTFLLGIERYNQHMTIFCEVAALLIHFFALASLMWMSVEAVHMYLLFVKVYNAGINNFVMKASIVSWGTPLIVVGITFGIWHEEYTHEAYCFMGWNEPMWYGFLPFLTIFFTFNAICYALIINRFFRKNPSDHASSKTSWQKNMRRYLNSLAIAVLLGISWVFAFLALAGKGLFVFDILFCFFNSLTGFFIFILFCVRHEEFREPWRRWFALDKKTPHTKYIDVPSVNLTKFASRGTSSDVC